jgi:hypothetical protein
MPVDERPNASSITQPIVESDGDAPIYPTRPDGTYASEQKPQGFAPVFACVDGVWGSYYFIDGEPYFVGTPHK